jgi:hypothetical protein
MKFPGFLGPSVPARSPAINPQRTINLYLEIDQQNGKAPLAMYGMPGLTRLATMASGPIRALWVAAGRNFVVAGNTLYELSPSFVPTVRGQLVTVTGPVQLLDNGLQLGAFDGNTGYALNLQTNEFTRITADGFPSNTVSTTYQDGYVVAVFPDSQKFGTSKIADLTQWDALDFASAEGLPDNLVAVISVQRTLFLMGSQSLEAWSNSGGADFAFSRIEGSFVETGCASAQSVVKLDNGFFFLGSDGRGAIGVYKVGGVGSLSKVSNGAIESEFATYADLSKASAIGFNYDGHVFYVISFPDSQMTWVYDITSQAWTEWLYFTPAGYQRHRAATFAVMNGRLVVGDYQDGRLYALDGDNFTDDGTAIRAARVTTIISQDEKQFSHYSLQVVMQQGVGTQTGQGKDPQLMLRSSNDGGRTWGNERRAPIGKIGEYAGRTRWNRLGLARNRTYEIAVTDPVRRVFLGAQID